MKLNKINVTTKDGKYRVYIGNNIIRNLNKIFKREKILFNKVLFVLDNKVPSKNSHEVIKNIKCRDKIFYKIVANEKNKNLNNVEKIIEILLENNFSRSDCLVGIGGGIIGDLSCFAASIYKRGIKFINIPTTLLAQVDASIGGKSGVNHLKFGKNLIGSFYQPKIVITDTSFLNSLNKREILCGYAEILKHTLIRDLKGFNFLNNFSKEILSLKEPYITNAIINSCKIKKKVVEEDEIEKKLRKILNLGHTFGHAFESAIGLNKNLNHGEGVLLGIKCAIKFSLKKKYLSYKSFNLIMGHFEKLKFNLKLNNFFKLKDVRKIVKFMINDKKNSNDDINLVLLKNLGQPIINKKFNINQIEIFLRKELNNI
tara:strand:- start:8580 stop:9692 length:1113 start_codon:yes stop_codon:yes gene_type:complete